MLSVLIVDDEKIVRTGLVMGIDWASLGCVVVAESSDGEEGFEMAMKYKPDLIICDTPRETIEICRIGGFDEKYIAEAYYGKAGRVFKDKEEMCDVWVYCTQDTFRELYGKDYVIPSYKES